MTDHSLMGSRDPGLIRLVMRGSVSCTSPPCNRCYQKPHRAWRGVSSRRSQPPLALAVPLSRFTSRVGGGSAFFVRPICKYNPKASLDCSICQSAFGLCSCLRPAQCAWAISSDDRGGIIFILRFIRRGHRSEHLTRIHRQAHKTPSVVVHGEAGSFMPIFGSGA